MPAAEIRFRAMGSECHVIVVDGAENAIQDVERTIHRLEELWSRFLPDSDISRLNRHSGLPQRVSPETIDLLTKAVEARRMTDGRFDPTVLGSVVAAGYRYSTDDPRSLLELPSHRPQPARAAYGSIEIDVQRDTARLPEGIGFDPGGIGKGLAADLAVTSAVERGALGALVNIGGDLRVAGRPATGDAWLIAVEDPFVPDRDIAVLRISDGGVATSNRIHARRRIASGAVEHIVDPATGAPTAGSIVSSTVVAGAGWVAEAFSKAALLDGIEAIDRAELEGLVVLEDGHMAISLRVGAFA